ncbi:MAG: hypothetical protein WCD43_13210 [Candidatus Acidiferrales bacterium]
MKGRLGLLICGVVLMAAPVWADKGPDADSLKDSGSGGGSGYAADGFKFGGTSGMGIHADSLSGVESDKLGYSATTNFVRASRENAIGEIIQNPPAMAEPGALPLILLGLVSVGFLVRRRGEPAKI